MTRRIDIKESYSIDREKTLYTRTKNFIVYGILPIFTGSFIIGVFTGVVVALFMILIEKIGELSKEGYIALIAHPEYIALCVLGLVLLAIIMHCFLKKCPEGEGGGVPRSMQMVEGKNKGNPIKIIFAYFFGATVSVLGGLNVGTEGPSVQLGAAVGSFGADSFKWRDKTYYINSGVSAGFAAAFSSPLAGVVFAVEEIRQKVNPLAIASACFAIFGAVVPSQLLYELFNIKIHFFPIDSSITINSTYFYVFIFLGLMSGLLSTLFQKVMIQVRRRMNRSRVSTLWVIIVVFVLSGFTGVVFASHDGTSLGAGSGLGVIKYIFFNPNGALDLLTTSLLLIARFALIILIFRSGATGGMMIPTLAVGALVGTFFGEIVMMSNMPTDLYFVIVLAGMVSFFTSSITAPFTGIFLALECVNIQYIPYIILATGFSFIVVKIFRCNDLYETLSEKDIIDPPEFKFLKKIKK